MSFKSDACVSIFHYLMAGMTINVLKVFNLDIHLDIKIITKVVSEVFFLNQCVYKLKTNFPTEKKIMIDFFAAIFHP